MKKDGILTIALTSYNYGHYIGEAIESVINQTSSSWRLVIYDNCSTDDTLNVIEPYLQDERITLVIHDTNIGSRANMMQAAMHADNEFYLSLCADDAIEPYFVEQALTLFEEYPSSPFVFFDWMQRLEESGIDSPHGTAPFPSKRVGPTFISPYLSICNFIPLHMAVFRTGLMKAAFEKVTQSPTSQLGEQLLYKLLEDEYGPACRSGMVGGFWRRHQNQLTLTHVDNGVAMINEPVERDWYLRQAKHNGSATAFMVLVSLLRLSARVSIFSAAKWLFSPEGRRYAASFGLDLENNQLKFQQVLIVVALKFGTYTHLGQNIFDANEIKDWFAFMGAEFSIEKLKSLLYETMLSEGESLINEEEIEQICLSFFGDLPESVNEEKSNVSKNLLLNSLIQSHEQTGAPILTLASLMVEHKQGQLPTEVDIEMFLLSACQFAITAITQKALLDVTTAERGELEQISLFLISDRFKVYRGLALEIRKDIADFELDCKYQQWINNHALLEIDAQIHAERMIKWTKQPQFNCFMFMFDGEEPLLANTIDSLSKQFYQNWKLTVIADRPSPDPMFEEAEVLEWVHFPDGEEPYSFLNQLIASDDEQWLMFIPAGTEFEPHAFLSFGDYIQLQNNNKIFYVDDDLIDIEGKRSSPRFKPDFNLDLLRSTDFVGVTLCEGELFKLLGGYDSLPAHESYGLTFKAYEQLGAIGIGHISDVLIHLPETVSGQYSQAVTQQAVEQHLQRQGIKAYIEPGLVRNSVRVEYDLSALPRVSIIVPTKDKIEFFRPCLESVLQKTTYSNYEIIVVDNQSEDPDILAYFDSLEQNFAGRVTVLSYPYPFNYAAISNMAAEQATGDYLLFLNNDTEVVHAEWLERMLRHAHRPEVGVVGARLVFPETGLLQHAGIVMGMETVADHPFLGILDIQEPGYMGRAQLDQNYSAVTGACLMVRKSVYDEVGGMDEVNLTVSYNDVDLCLKVNKQGYLVTWTPFSVLVHHGSVTQKSELTLKEAEKVKRFSSEREYMLNTWPQIIANDPAYNRHLSLAHRNMSIEAEMPCNWDTNFHEKKRVLGLPLSGGSGDYRVMQPFDALSFSATAQCEYYHFGYNLTRKLLISEYSRLSPDVVVFQAAVNDVQLGQIDDVKKYLPQVKRVYSIDDLLTNVPEYSPAYISTRRHFANVKQRMRRALAACDRLIVSTQPLADLCKDMIDDIRVIPNRLTVQKWGGLTPAVNSGEKFRIGWAGAQQHQGDLAIITEVVKETAELVDWVFMGMCPDDIKPYVAEYHDFVSIEEYPEKLASLALDLAIAPLEVNEFNEAKSNLRLLEYGVMGWPVICTDVYPYQTNNPPVIRLANEKQAWLDAIHQAIANPEQTKLLGLALREWVLKDYILEDHLAEWSEALYI